MYLYVGVNAVRAEFPTRSSIRDSENLLGLSLYCRGDAYIQICVYL